MQSNFGALQLWFFFAMSFWSMQRRGPFFFFFRIYCEVFRCFETKSEVFQWIFLIVFFAGNPGCNLKPSNMRVIDCKWRMCMSKDFWGGCHCVYLHLFSKVFESFPCRWMGRVVEGFALRHLKRGAKIWQVFSTKKSSKKQRFKACRTRGAMISDFPSRWWVFPSRWWVFDHHFRTIFVSGCFADVGFVSLEETSAIENLFPTLQEYQCPICFAPFDEGTEGAAFGRGRLPFGGS